MIEIVEEPKTFKVELTLEEVLYIRAYMQNYVGKHPDDELQADKDVRLSLFVGANRLLGVDMLDNGTVARTWEADPVPTCD